MCKLARHASAALWGSGTDRGHPEGSGPAWSGGGGGHGWKAAWRVTSAGAGREEAHHQKAHHAFPRSKSTARTLCLLGTPKCTRGVALGFVTRHVDHAAFTPFPDPTGQWATELWGLLPPGRLTWNSVSCLWRASCSARALSRVFLSSLSSNSLTGRKGERKPSFSILSSTQTCPSFRTRPPPGSRRGPAACGQPHNPL